MKKEELYRFVDHTALKAVTTWKEIQQLCQEARFFRMASVCIPSSYVKRAHEYFPELNICTVVGFPLGNANTEAKLMETRQALADGASEIDMVINLGTVYLLHELNVNFLFSKEHIDKRSSTSTFSLKKHKAAVLLM
jgi:deoxyribose-phosphate aldolase